MSDELKPCPFCGGDELSHVRIDERRGFTLVHCCKCGGGNSLSRWNTRADLPATDAQAMANPKVQALVEAAFWVEASLEHHGYMQTGSMRSRLRAALAALEADNYEQGNENE